MTYSNTLPRNNQPPNSNNSQEIDWEKLSIEIIEDVAHRLMPHRPHQIIGGSLRFGNNNSFAVDPDQGVFYDHEDDVGGGVFQMVMHLRDCDKRTASQWLSDNGYLDNTFTPSERSSMPHNRRQRPRSQEKRNMFEVGLELWNEASTIPFYQHHPVRRWSRRRAEFPGFQELPPTIRWHEQYKKGCIIVALAPVSDFVHAYPAAPEPKQFQLISIDKQGRKGNAFLNGGDKRTYGTPGVCCVSLFSDTNTDEIYIAEGVADAIGIHGKHPDVPVIATIGSLSKLVKCQQSINYLSDASKRSVTIFPDNDNAGIQGRDKLMKTIGSNGGDVYYVENWKNADPADAVATGGVE